MAIEEIWAARIRDQRTGNSGGLSLRFSAQQVVQVSTAKTDLRAGKIFQIFAQHFRVQFLAFEKSAEISVAGLGSNFTRGHPQVGTDHGVEPQFGIRNLCHGRIIPNGFTLSKVLPMGIEPTTAILETAALPLSYGSDPSAVYRIDPWNSIRSSTLIRHSTLVIRHWSLVLLW